MRRSHSFIAILFASLIALASFGCTERGTPSPEGPAATKTPTSAEDLDVHITAEDVERPANYAAAVQRIISYRDAIREAVAAGHPGRAHRPLDEASFVLDWMPELARDSGVPKGDWEAVNTSAQQIRTLFDLVHARIDNQEAPDFGSVADRVQEAIDTLSSIQGSPSDGRNAVNGHGRGEGSRS